MLYVCVVINLRTQSIWLNTFTLKQSLDFDISKRDFEKRVFELDEI